MLRPLTYVLALALMAGAAHAQEREWMLDVSEEDAYLIFGVPDSDDVGVSLWCPLGKGAVNLFLPVPTAQLPRGKDKAAPLTIIAGKETATFRGKADINQEASVSSLEAEIAMDHPLTVALREADRFTVRTGTMEIVFPLYESDVDGLLELCKRN